MRMPRSVDDLPDHADELAERFEGYEPAQEDEAAVAEHLLRKQPSTVPDPSGRSPMR